MFSQSYAVKAVYWVLYYQELEPLGEESMTTRTTWDVSVWIKLLHKYSLLFSWFSCYVRWSGVFHSSKGEIIDKTTHDKQQEKLPRQGFPVSVVEAVHVFHTGFRMPLLRPMKVTPTFRISAMARSRQSRVPKLWWAVCLIASVSWKSGSTSRWSFRDLENLI